MEFGQKQEAPLNVPEKKNLDKKTLVVYVITGAISFSSIIFAYASYQSTYFKDMEIKELKTQLNDANTKLHRINALENQVKELQSSLKNKDYIKSKTLKQNKKASTNQKKSFGNAKPKIKLVQKLNKR
jgi:phosphoglycerol transferase MdoB-like AlkP superfamily enzyme